MSACCTSTVFASTWLQIPEVSLRAAQALSKKRDAALQTTHLSPEAISTSPVETLSALLSQEQSIVRLTNNSGDNNQSAVSLRGFGDNAAANSLILIDGFPLTTASLLAANVNAIALADIVRVDIMQGSQGTLWGDQAVGGVVNIITRHPDRLWTVVNVSRGSHATRYFSGYASDHFANGIFLKSFALARGTDNDRHHNRQANENVSATAGIDYTYGVMSVTAQTYDDALQYPGGLTQAQYDSDPHQATNFRNMNERQTTVYRIFNHHELTENYLLESRLWHQEIHSHGYLFFPFEQRERLTAWAPRLLGVDAQQKWIMGMLLQQSDFGLTNPRATVHADAKGAEWFGQFTLSITPALAVTLGSRYAQQLSHAQKKSERVTSAANHVVVAETGLTFNPDAHWSFFVRRDGNFRFAKANELSWVVATQSSLAAQTGESIEAGATWMDERTRLQIYLYRLTLQNEIAFDPTPCSTQPFGAFRNFAYTQRVGTTATADQRINEIFSWHMQVNYVAAQFAAGAFKGNTMPAVPAWTGNLGFNTWWHERWRLKYAMLYTGAQYASDDDANVGSRLPSYTLHTVALQYIWQSLVCGMEITNLFNQRYSAFTLYHPTDHTNTYYPGMGRAFLLTFKTSLG